MEGQFGRALLHQLEGMLTAVSWVLGIATTAYYFQQSCRRPASADTTDP